MILLLVVFGGLVIWMKWEVIRQSAITEKNTKTARSLLLAMKSFSSDYDGKFPGFDEEEASIDSLFLTSEVLMKVLVDEGYVDTPEALNWENPETGERLPWIYVAGRTETAFSKDVVLVAPGLESSGGRRIVGFLGGHVVKLADPEVEELLKNVRKLPGSAPNPVHHHP
ncbi:MAG: hypothetical protein KDN20_15825 [Verrucomicrobiae bacterium]|nr:hypothetical protein [Verrucomicrobiae bacterium]